MYNKTHQKQRRFPFGEGAIFVMMYPNESVIAGVQFQAFIVR